MAVLNILEYPDPRLTELSLPVAAFGDNTAQLATDLIDTMHASESIGLSAVQIGIHQQLLVMDHTRNRTAPEIYINPKILSRKGYGLVEERCLSVPGVKVNVLRATHVMVRAQDPSGERFERELSGMPAVCMQHEMDHFNGRLLVDRINWFRRRRLRAALARQVNHREAAT